MANTFNDTGRLWELDADDILSFKDHDNPNSGLMPIVMRKVILTPAATGDGVTFKTLKPNATPTVNVGSLTFTVTSTYRITDPASGAVFTGASVGDWLHVHESPESGNNLGWFYITAVDGSKHYVDVAYAQNALTNETTKTYSIKIYTPESCMVMVSPTGDTGAKLIQAEVLDWGDSGRRFYNLGMFGLSASCTARIYIK